MQSHHQNIGIEKKRLRLTFDDFCAGPATTTQPLTLRLGRELGGPRVVRGGRITLLPTR